MLLLIVLHHIADVAFQPSWLIQKKKLHAFAVYEHSMVWAGVVSIGLLLLGKYSLGKFLFLLAGHFLIDSVKYRYFKDYRWTYLDQLLHYMQLLLVSIT